MLEVSLLPYDLQSTKEVPEKANRGRGRDLKRRGRRLIKYYKD